jgi:hypothetical protein
VTRKGRAITLSVNEHQKLCLEAIARDFGITWGDKPNISQLVKAIADGKLRLAVNHGWDRDRLDVLNLARGALMDAGKVNEAIVIAELMLERSELSSPLRAEVQKFVDKPSFPWRLNIEQMMRQYRPFRLTYQDAAERMWSFTVRHARIVPYGDRQYLDCWCDETEGSQDIPELRHNWSLRLDRIPEEAIVSPVSGAWQPDLASVEVEMHLLNRLALAYRSKKGADLVNEWDGDRQLRRVVRRVHHTFWFVREVLPYGADCVVVSPPAVRRILAREIAAMAERYRDGLD